MLHKVCYIYPYIFLISCFVGDEQFFFSHVSLANMDAMQKISFSVKNMNLKIVVRKRLHILFLRSMLILLVILVPRIYFKPLERMSWIRKSAYSPASAIKSQIGNLFIA